MKESYAKYLGIGINLDFKNLTFDLDKNINYYNDLIIKTYKLQDYYMSICNSSEDGTLNEISVDELLNQNYDQN